jgi:hypothetical protein
MHQRGFIRCVLSLFFVATASFANAPDEQESLILSPCGSAVLPGVMPTSGLVLYDQLVPFEVFDSNTGGLLYRGVLQNRVIRLNSTGRLAFAYRVRDTVAGIPGAIDGLATESFEGLTTDVDYTPLSLGTMRPDGASRSCDGSLVEFDYSTNLIRAGSSSKFVVIGTEAEFFAPGGSTTIALRSGQTVRVPTVQPVTDNSPPIVGISSPGPFECVCNPTQIIGTVNDPESGFGSWTLDYAANPAGPWTTISSGNTAVVNGPLGTWNTTALTQGNYFLRLTAENGVGLTNSITTVVFVDKQFDTLDFRSPGNGAVLAGKICPDGTAWDRCFKQYTIGYRPAGGGQYTPIDPGNPTYGSTVINDPLGVWDTITAGVPDGKYDIRLTGTDICGNTEKAVHTVIVDNTPPVAEITSPVNCTYHCGVIDIFGTALDANMAGWSLQYTGGSTNNWVTIATGTNSISNGLIASWDTTLLENCAYTIRLIVTDEASINCTPFRHQSTYQVSINVGAYADCDTSTGPGVLDIFDFLCFQDAFIKGCQ